MHSKPNPTERTVGYSGEWAIVRRAPRDTAQRPTYFGRKVTGRGETAPAETYAAAMELVHAEQRERADAEADGMAQARAQERRDTEFRRHISHWMDS